MKAISLQSGSNGNCIYVESGDTRLLIDAGISGIQAEKRLAVHGVDIRKVNGVFISHDHSDHIRSAGIYSRKYALPIHVTQMTLQAAIRKGGPGKIPHLKYFEAGDSITTGDVIVETISTPHDGVDGVVFVVDDGSSRIGVCTDLGHVFSRLGSTVDSLDGVFLESNYDDDMLETGPYPYFLKERIRGDGGHISNNEAATLLDSAFHQKLQWACLCHLSEQNNDPAVAMDTHRQLMGPDKQIHVASRYEVSPVFHV